ncbi:MAG: glycosyltransferase [Pseudomonadota bacterium]
MAESIPAPERQSTPQLSLIVLLQDPGQKELDALLASFRSQSPGLAELIIVAYGHSGSGIRNRFEVSDTGVDVQVLHLDQPRNITDAANAGIHASRGTWIGLIEQGDLIAPHGLKMVVRALQKLPDTQFLYTDEVIVDPQLGARSLVLKPGFDPVLLSGVDYVNHLSVYRCERLLSMGGFDPAFEDSLQYELVLRYCRGLAADQIAHLPYPAYIHQQRAAGSTTIPQARAALEKHFAKPTRQISAGPAPAKSDLHRIRFLRSEAEWPHISVILPNLDSPALVQKAVDGVLQETDYPALELIVLDNGSTNQQTLGLYDRIQSDPRVKVEIRPAPFNFSAMINRGAELATGRHLLLLNNDIAVEDPGWLKEMVGCLDYAGTGIVGAKLLFPDRRIQHAGVILGLNDIAGHWFYKQPEHTLGPDDRLTVRNSMSVVTGAVMLISDRCWQTVGSFNETAFRVAYNDVDYCARARAAGFGVVWTPYAQLIHHENATRGRDDVRRNKARFAGEQAALRDTHGTVGFEDPALSPWWSRSHSRPRELRRGSLPEPRHFMGFPADSPGSEQS